MFIINQENWEVVKKTNIIGSNFKNRVDLIKKDDLIIIYAIRPLSSILGAYKVISKTVEKKVKFTGGSYPHQIKLEPIEILKEPIDFKSIVDNLEFIKRKDKWNTYLFGVKGIRKLSKNDYDVMVNSF